MNTNKENIGLMANRAESILYLLSEQFKSSGEMTVTHDIVFAAIDTAIREIESIKQSID